MTAQQELLKIVGPLMMSAQGNETIAKQLVQKAAIATEMALQTTPLANDMVLLEAIELAKNWAAGKASADQIQEMLARLKQAGSYAENANLAVITVQDLALAAKTIEGDNAGHKMGMVMNLCAIVSQIAPAIIRENAPDKAEETLQKLLAAIK